MNYTVLGDAANLASRLEGINKYYGEMFAKRCDEYLKSPPDSDWTGVTHMKEK